MPRSRPASMRTRTSTGWRANAPARSTRWCAKPGPSTSANAIRWPCSRSAATAAANCSRIRTSTCWRWPGRTCRRSRRKRWPRSSPRCGTPACRSATRCVPPRNAAARPPKTSPCSPRCWKPARWSRMNPISNACATRSRRAMSAARAATSPTSARNWRRGTRASATPPTTSSPTSRKARAACATCRRCTGWRCACSAPPTSRH